MELMTYLLLVIFKLSASNGYVEIIPQTTNWIEAKKECFNRGGILAHPNELHPSNCEIENLNVWTGKYDYERPTPWIAKIGCFLRHTPFRHTKPPLVECYSSCKSTAFGFMNPYCSCENETTSVLQAIAPCSTSENNNALWFYNETQIDVSHDHYKMDCITAQCTENGIKFRAVNCSSNKNAYCQKHRMSLNAGENTQANSERICNKNLDHLISKQIYTSLCMDNMTTPEFWTGIRRYRYNSTESLTGNDRKDMNSADIYNCVAVKCENGEGPAEYTENCRQQLEGFACIFNDTSNNVTTVKPSTVGSLASANVSSPRSNSLQFQSTTDTLKLFSDQSSKNAVDASIQTGMIESTSAITNNIDMSTTKYTSDVKNKTATEFIASKSIHSTTTLSSYSGSRNLNTVYPSSENWFTSAIFSSSESSSFHLHDLGHLSTSVSSQSTIDTSVYVGIRSSVLISVKSNIESSILPTSVTLKSFSEYSSKHVVRTYIKTSSKLAKNSNIDMSSTVYSLVVKNKSGTELNENNKMYSTTTRNPNNSRSHQFSTGLIVGISVSVLVVLIIGLFGICRLRHQGPFKDKALDYTIPMTKTIYPNYLDIDVNLEKKTHVIGNDSTQPMITTTDDDKQIDITNGTTNIPNDVYAVVVKNGISSTSKTEKNQDKDENTSSNKPESDYHILHQSRRISGNESNNIYDTSGGHTDDNDPTYNTTTHVHAKERANESDYDHF